MYASRRSLFAAQDPNTQLSGLVPGICSQVVGEPAAGASRSGPSQSAGVGADQRAGIGQLECGTRGRQRGAGLTGGQPCLRAGGPGLEFDGIAGCQPRRVP